VRVFLLGDAASAAHRNQKVPQGFYNIEVMLGNVTRNGSEVGICGTRMEARGMGESGIVDKTPRSTWAQLAEWKTKGDFDAAFARINPDTSGVQT
jgi:uncharacterized protein involved in oxidation of intracellular sulfur